LLEKLEFLLALAREKHFGRAAKHCGVTQPTLSAGVKQLEDAFGVLLVNRGSRFQGFTAEGERVLDWARRIVGDTRAMRQEVHALKHGLAAYLARIDDLALLACAYWTLGERNAGAARYDAWSHRCPAFDSNRGSGSNAHDRIGGASTRANDDVDRCARRRSTACRTAIVGLKSKTRELASMKLFSILKKRAGAARNGARFS
jgi:Bacterial regulatory helix-turn-helix protein, lysR family